VKDLPDDVHERVKILCAAGDQLAAQESYVDAIAKYEEAFAQLPEPRTDWDAATWIKAALADAHFFSGDYQACWNATQDAVKCCPGALENAFLHLRAGQAAFELEWTEVASQWLTTAWMAEGDDLFRDEDPKYLALLRRILRPASNDHS
jgi:hypothetical protein